MPYRSKAQATYFHIHRKELEGQGVDVSEWDRESRGKKLPEHVRDRAKKALKKRAAELLRGGIADGMPDRDFNVKDLEHGTDHEMEHVKDMPHAREMAKETAKDHLAEHPDYYKKLERLFPEEKTAGMLNTSPLVKVSARGDQILKLLSKTPMQMPREMGDAMEMLLRKNVGPIMAESPDLTHAEALAALTAARNQQVPGIRSLKRLGRVNTNLGNILSSLDKTAGQYSGLPKSFFKKLYYSNPELHNKLSRRGGKVGSGVQRVEKEKAREAVEREARIQRAMNPPKPPQTEFNFMKDAALKVAKSMELKGLIKAKKLSDNRDYVHKNELVRKLLEKNPEAFRVDSHLNSKYVGITHIKSGFRIHAPRNVVPAALINPYPKAEEK